MQLGCGPDDSRGVEVEALDDSTTASRMCPEGECGVPFQGWLRWQKTTQISNISGQGVTNMGPHRAISGQLALLVACFSRPNPLLRLICGVYAPLGAPPACFCGCFAQVWLDLEACLSLQCCTHVHGPCPRNGIPAPYLSSVESFHHSKTSPLRSSDVPYPPSLHSTGSLSAHAARGPSQPLQECVQPGLEQLRLAVCWPGHWHWQNGERAREIAQQNCSDIGSDQPMPPGVQSWRVTGLLCPRSTRLSSR